MNIDQRLKNVPRTKSFVELLQNEYNSYSDMLEQMECVSSETSEKIKKILNSIYDNIQTELTEYKTIIAAVKHLTDLKQMLIHFHYFDRKSLKEISEMMNYNYEYLRKVKKAALKDLENILLKDDGNGL